MKEVAEQKKGRKSPLEDVDNYEDLLTYMKEGGDYKLYKCEVASAEDWVRGVGISRAAKGVYRISKVITSEEGRATRDYVVPFLSMDIEEEADELTPK